MDSRHGEGIRTRCLGSASTGPKSLFWYLLVVGTCWTSAPSSIRPQCWFSPQGACVRTTWLWAGAQQLKLSLSPHISYTSWTCPSPFPRDAGVVLVRNEIILSIPLLPCPQTSPALHPMGLGVLSKISRRFSDTFKVENHRFKVLHLIQCSLPHLSFLSQDKQGTAQTLSCWSYRFFLSQENLSLSVRNITESGIDPQKASTCHQPTFFQLLIWQEKEEI